MSNKKKRIHCSCPDCDNSHWQKNPYVYMGEMLYPSGYSRKLTKEEMQEKTK